MNLQWIEEVRRAFGTLYGEKKGTEVCNAVIPGIIGDFRKTVLASADGGEVQEEYITEDRRAVIHMTGHARDSACVITHLTVNGHEVSLGGKELAL